MNINIDLLEKELEDIIEEYLLCIADPENKSRRKKMIEQRDFNLLSFNGKISVFRQLDLGGWRCDLLTHERKGSTHYINLFELRRGEANGNTLTEAFKYKVQIERYLKERGITDFFIRIHLLATFISYDLNFLQGLEGDGFDLSIREVGFYTSHGILFNK